MAVYQNNIITGIAGEDLEPYRRVKYNGSTANYFVYADATDGASFIGVTLPGPDGDYVASGGNVSVALWSAANIVKVESSAAVTLNNSIYPEDDGKISDDAGTVVIGTAALDSVSAGAAQIVSVIPNNGSGSAPDEEAVANANATNNLGITLTAVKTGLASLATTHNVCTAPRKLKLVRAWGTCRNGATDSDVLLKVGDTAICAALTFTGTDETQEFALTDAVTEVASGSTIYASIATALTAPGMDIYVQCVPIA